MTRKQKKSLCSIILSAVLLVVAKLLGDVAYVTVSLYILAYLIAGFDTLRKAFRNILRGNVFDENFLMAIATIGAIIIKEYTEGVAVMLFYRVGELFESIAVGKSRKSISELMDIRPDRATVIRDGEEIVVSPDEVEVGELIVVAPGEKVAIDGIIVDGSSTLDTSALTGESLPRTAAIGDRIQSGFINLSGVITIKTECTFETSTAAKILELVENASSKKTRSEAFITRFARYYTPAVVFSALALAVIPSIVFGNPLSWVKRALIFLVISCPCALVISVPLTFFGAIGCASKKGILIKGSCYIEQLSKAGIVVFDKTGTLTKGSFSVTAIHENGIGKQRLLELAAISESRSSHPIALSVIRAYGKKPDQSQISSISEVSGQGVIAQIGDDKVYCGNSKLMNSIGIDTPECHRQGTIVHVAVNGQYEGHIIINDEIKEDAREAITLLSQSGVRRTVMLTGDSEAIAQRVAKELCIDEYHAELLPTDKASLLEKIIEEKDSDSTVVFIGDGINDAPVISRADVGIAMGALGSDAAIEAADVVLMDDKPSKTAFAVKLSKKAISIARGNIIFALSVKLLVLILGALGYAGMWLAVFADVGVSVIAICNAMRTLRIKE